MEGLRTRTTSIPTMASMFHVGDICMVDGFTHGTIMEVKTSTTEENGFQIYPYLTVQYTLCGRTEKNIHSKRVKVISVSTLCYTRSNMTSRVQHYTRPLSDSHQSTSASSAESSLITTTTTCPPATSITTQQQSATTTNPSSPSTTSTAARTTTTTSSTTTTSTSPTATATTTNNNTTRPASTTTTTSTKTTNQLELENTLKQCYDQRHSTSNPDNPPIKPLFDLLKNNSTKPKGWIRKVISPNAKDNSLMDEKQTLVLVFIQSLFFGFTPKNGTAVKFTSYITHAFGIHRTTITRVFKKFISSGFQCSRESRKDIGLNVFNSHKKRTEVFTAYHVFRKLKYQEWRSDTAKIDERNIKEEFENLPDHDREVLELQAQRDLERAVHLKDELEALLLKTKGKLSYHEMANQLGNLVCANTIRNYLRSRPTFRMRKNRILPHLDKAAKLRRIIWAESFWVFWKSARCCNVKKVRFVMLHMDEKWFFAVRSRTNTKVLVEIGLLPHDYHVQHKNHIGKTMFVVVTAFVLHDNDITHGGFAVPIACVPVGKMVMASKDSYKRVYINGKARYPKYPENLIRKKGQLYFKACELTGSSEGTEKSPKMSLLNVYKNNVIPELRKKIFDVYGKNENGEDVKLVLVKQEDGAGTHQDKKYVKEMDRLWHDELGGIIFNQPSQSPVTNVHDACIFPMMSKCVSRDQANIFGAKLLKVEQLNETVLRVFNDRSHLVAMGRAFAGHHQVVCAIMACNGDNNYLKERKGMSFGIRRTFVSTADGNGVQLAADDGGVDDDDDDPVPVGEGTGIEMLDLAPNNYSETVQGIIESEHRITKRLKYTPPDIRTLKRAELTEEMESILLEHMDPDLMTGEVTAFWGERLWGADDEDNPSSTSNN